MFTCEAPQVEVIRWGSCYCGDTEVGVVHHALWNCYLYGKAHRVLIDGIKVVDVGPVHNRNLIDSEVNFRRLRDFAR